VTAFIVTSAFIENGGGYGSVLSFSAQGELMGSFSDDERITDPRGLSIHPTNGLVYINGGPDRVLALDRNGRVVFDSGRIEGLDPGGGVFAPDGRYCVTLRRRGTVLSMPPGLEDEGRLLLPEGAVPFPRGFGFGSDGSIFLSSGIGPTGEGDNTIALFSQDGIQIEARLVEDPELSPLDLTVAPNGNLVVNSEWPFGAAQAQVTVREYNPSTGQLLRVLTPESSVGFVRPRGLRLTADGVLYCVGRDHVIAFDFATGRFLDVIVDFAAINGQAVVVLP
jgi:hypothetical protein